MDDYAKHPLLQKLPQDAREKENSAAAVNLLFVKRIGGLMRIARCEDCALLVALSVFEVAILSQAGLVVGHFYNALISKDSQLFVKTVAQYLLWYSAEALCSAAQQWASEYLAIRWRQNLTQAAHLAYTGEPSLRRLSQHYVVDNPDERITNEIIYLCQTLAQIMLKTVSAPLMILYYTWWVWYHVGWFAPIVIYGFFVAGAVWTRWIISPIANLVARQEKLEAFFRISHVQFRGNAEAIAMSDGAKYERARLEEDLQAAIANRKKLVSRHFLLTINTRAYDYLGGALNYCVLAIPVFGGIFDSDDSGQLANLVSNASFAVLQLIYSFSQVMDTSKLVSDLAGYTARVGEFFEVLEILPNSSVSSKAWPIFGENVSNHSKLETDLKAHEEGYLISTPTCFELGKDRTIELSIHFPPQSFHEGISKRFSGIAPASLLIVPVFEANGTFIAGNEAKDAVSDMELSVSVEYERSKPLPPTNLVLDKASGHRMIFLELILNIVEKLRGLGYWTDALDPCTGCSLSSFDPKGQELSISRVVDVASTSTSGIPSVLAKAIRYNQMDVVKLLLGYSSIEVDSVSVIDHPRFGQKYILSSIFTTAGVKVVEFALDICLREVATSCEVEITSSGNKLFQTVQTSGPDLHITCNLEPALAVDNITCFIPDSQIPVVQNLSIQLLWGESLLVMGVTGSGKTSFLRALCGLWPLQSGKVRIPPMLGGKGVLVLPQQPFMARTGLISQIMYPEFCSTESLSSQRILRLKEALEAVGMNHLVNKLNQNWEMDSSDWADHLSPGEQQSLALARVFYHQPQLVILDEATSALTEDAEDAIYEKMLSMRISFISVAHRSKLIRLHTKLLVLHDDGRGSWSLT